MVSLVAELSLVREFLFNSAFSFQYPESLTKSPRKSHAGAEILSNLHKFKMAVCIGSLIWKLVYLVKNNVDVFLSMQSKDVGL